MPQPTVRIFASAVTDEFGSYRSEMASYLTRPGVVVEEQDKFIRNGLPILKLLDDYIQTCDAVIHLLGDRTGNPDNDGIPGEENIAALRARYPDLLDRLKLNEDDLAEISYTQWEALLALYHQPAKNVRLLVGTPDPTLAVPRDQKLTDPVISARQRATQQRHLNRLIALEHWPDFTFQSAHHLCLRIYHNFYGLLPSPQVPIAPLLPRSLGRLFKGRDSWLAKIREAIRSGNNDDAIRVVVHGMGGLGKTRLAAEYAWACSHEHSALLYVSGETEQTLRSGLSELCGVLRLEQRVSDNEETRVKATLEWLEQTEHRNWLLIVDNVDDRKQAFQAVLDTVSQFRRGVVLITSRIDRWPQGFVGLKLDLLDRESAMEYLLDATDQRIQLDDELGAGTDRRLAETIVENLGQLALGLVQATGTINTLRMSFQDYLTQWQTSREELLDDPDFDPQVLNYPRSVAETWLTSYRQLPPETQWVFDLLCWFAAEPIPERLITQPWPAEVREKLPETIANAIRENHRKLMVPLYDFSLAEPPVGTQRLFTIHRLVQEVGRIWQKKSPPVPSPREFAWQTIERDFVRPDDIYNLQHHILPQLRPLFPHVREVLQDAQLIDQQPLVASRLYRAQAEFTQVTGQWQLGETYAQQAVALSQPRGDAESVKSLLTHAEALSVLCQLLDSRGQFDRALDIGTQGLEVCQSLCELEPDNLAHQRELGIALHNVGRVREKKGEQDAALELFEQSRKISDKLCQADATNWLWKLEFAYSEFYCGRALSNCGRKSEALAALQHAKQIIQELIDAQVGFGSLASDLQAIEWEIQRAQSSE